MRTSTLCAVALAIGPAGFTAQKPQEIKRFGMVVGLKAEYTGDHKTAFRDPIVLYHDDLFYV